VYPGITRDRPPRLKSMRCPRPRTAWRLPEVRGQPGSGGSPPGRSNAGRMEVRLVRRQWSGISHATGTLPNRRAPVACTHCTPDPPQFPTRKRIPQPHRSDDYQAAWRTLRPAISKNVFTERLHGWSNVCRMALCSLAHRPPRPLEGCFRFTCRHGLLLLEGEAERHPPGPSQERSTPTDSRTLARGCEGRKSSPRRGRCAPGAVRRHGGRGGRPSPQPRPWTSRAPADADPGSRGRGAPGPRTHLRSMGTYVLSALASGARRRRALGGCPTAPRNRAAAGTVPRLPRAGPIPPRGDRACSA
jgi:hypothetical protein